MSLAFTRPTGTRRSLVHVLAAASLVAAAGCAERPAGAPAQATSTSQTAPRAGAPQGSTRVVEQCDNGTSSGPHAVYAAKGIACATCHPAGAPVTGTAHAYEWMVTTSGTAFHGYAANQGLAGCTTCHGAALDGAGGSTTVSCAQCHGTAWASTCTFCHGGTDRQDGAPPKATFANSGDAVRTGTHTAHLGATHGIAGPVACNACHVVPADAWAPGHIGGGTAEVAFAGLAIQGITGSATWTRGSATCSNTYCHGATVLGGTAKAPVWTDATGSQRGCGACHGAPPANLSHTRTDLGCGSCHPGYTRTSVNLATHLNGTIEYSVSCTTCHGDATKTATPAAPLYAAPPAGSAGETATTALAVGAHAQHLDATKMQVANPFQCTACHVVPTLQLHATGVEDLAFGSLANNRPDPWQTSTYFTGTATGATTTTMTDATKNFGSRNSVRNQTIKFLSGTANGQTRTITNNSSTVVYWNTTQPVTGLAAGVSYQIGNPQTPIPPPALASFDRNTGKCSNVWCHGFSATTAALRNTLRGYPTHSSTTSNNFTAPTWTVVNGSQDTCSGCHGNSNTSYPAYPSTGRHTSESNHRVSCGRCHGGTYTTTVADKSVHVNGVVETPSIGWNKAANSCNGTGSGCHGTSTMTGWY